MRSRLSQYFCDHFPGYHRLIRLPKQIFRISPFTGDSLPSRVPLFKIGSGRPSLPFPHPWNFNEPIKILETYFWEADAEEGAGRDNRYLDFPGFAPVLVSRDPKVIRAITIETGNKEGQFDRDTLPSTGIARATGKDTLLFSNGATWKRQRMLAASPFGKTTLFQPEKFQEFAETFRATVAQRIDALRIRLEATGQKTLSIQLEPEIKAVMLELLTNNFFSTDISYEQIRNRFVPALEGVIDHIVHDTVINQLGIPLRFIPSYSKRITQIKKDYATFEELTSLVLATRHNGSGLWKQFKSDAPDEALRSNIKVFLAGALEATTSFASWAICHLARNPESQEKTFQDVKDIDDYTPENLGSANYLGYVLEESLRLTPSLYFLPRQATVDSWVETSQGTKMLIPAKTHVLLDVWHANRIEKYWGIDATGYPAENFAPERWENIAKSDRGAKEFLHFGFGHGPRVCPGKHLGQLEVGLTVGAFVKMFKFKATQIDCPAKAGVSTKPADGTLVELELR